MDIHALNCFLAVVRAETITGAARILYMTQPALTRQMQALEEELGTTLFLRGKRRITLTEDGRFLYRRAREIVELMERTSQAFHKNSTDIAGEVFISGGETRAMRMVARAACRVRSEHPAITFSIHSGNGDDVRDRLDRGLADFGVYIEPVDLSTYEFLRMPARDTWGVLIPSNHPLAARDAVGPEDLAGEPLIASRQTMVRNEMAAWFGAAYDRLNIVVRYSLLYNASFLVEQGMGIALCLDGILNLPEHGPLCFRPLRPAMEVGVCLAWKKNQVFSRAAACFLDTFRKEISSGDYEQAVRSDSAEG